MIQYQYNIDCRERETVRVEDDITVAVIADPQKPVQCAGEPCSPVRPPSHKY